VELKGKKNAGLSLVVVVVLVSVVLLAAAGSYYWFFGRKEPGDGEAASKKEISLVDGPLYEVGELVTNLAGEDSRRLIKVEIVLELADEKTARRLENQDAPVRNQILAVLRSKTAADLEAQGGIEVLAVEIKAELNELLGTEAVRRVYFTQLVVD